MSKRWWGAPAVGFALAFALAGHARAQDATLEEGMWTGTAYPPDGDMIELEYEVSYGETGLVIVLHPPAELGVGTLNADDPVYEAGALSFTLMVGDTVQCTLYQEEDGHLEGDCIDSSGEPALMTMYPPADG